MSYAFLLKKNIARILFYLFILVSIFLFNACRIPNTNSKVYGSTLSACLTVEEKADLEYLFRLLIFENHGAFVLFGSKPFCEMYLRDTESTESDVNFQKWFNSLPSDKRAAFKARMVNKLQVESESRRNPYKGWLAWEKVRKNIKMKHYILRIVPLRGPDRYELILVNIKQTSLVMSENYSIFKNAARMDFQPVQIVLELQNKSSVFWENFFSRPNYVAKGLLFGFGLKNSLFGELRFTYSNPRDSVGAKNYLPKFIQESSFSLSARAVKSDILNFPIPLFCSLEGDDTTDKYLKEKIEIEKIYQDQDIVEMTLRRLANS